MPKNRFATLYLVGDRVAVFDEERKLAGDMGTIVDVDARLHVKMDGRGEIEVDRSQCRPVERPWPSGSRAA
ncbi:MAG: hypothetical protein H7222_05475 [Methylotenera sp.]|nr:hypothetical protein [Oligoflexia bacterium]